MDSSVNCAQVSNANSNNYAEIDQSLGAKRKRFDSASKSKLSKTRSISSGGECSETSSNSNACFM